MRISLVVLAVVVAAARTLAVTWTVERDGTGDFQVIQDAVDAAASGDTLLIGPGRYIECQTYTGWVTPNPDCYVVISDKSLTMIGSGREDTIIGPEEAYYENDQTPFGVFVHSDSAVVDIRGITIENVARGICVDRNQIFAYDMSIVGCMSGMFLWVYGGGQVSRCEFYDNWEGILMMTCDRKMDISNLEMRGNWTGLSIQYSDSVYVEKVNINDCGVGVQYAEGASGRMHSCDITGVVNFGIMAVNGSSLIVDDCSVQGGDYFQVDCASCESLHVENSIFTGAGMATVRSLNGLVSMNGNHILNAGGYNVLTQSYVDPPTRVLDFENNYWGTSNRDSIEAWIYDENDDPSINAVVDFEPFSPVPLPDEKKSLGDVKRMFR